MGEIALRPTLKLLRQAANKTLAEAAKAAKVTPRTVQRWEASDTAPRTDQARALAHLYGVELDAMASLIDRSPAAPDTHAS